MGATGPLPSVHGTITGADRLDGRRKIEDSVRREGWPLHLGHGFWRCARGRAVGGRTRLLWRILRCAFSLERPGVKHAIAAKAAVGEGLRVVLESIGRSFGS